MSAHTYTSEYYGQLVYVDLEAGQQHQRRHVCAVIANTAQCVHVLVDVLIHIDEVQHRLLVHHPTNITALHWCHTGIHADNDENARKERTKERWSEVEARHK